MSLEFQLEAPELFADAAKASLGPLQTCVSYPEHVRKVVAGQAVVERRDEVSADPNGAVGPRWGQKPRDCPAAVHATMIAG